MFAEAVFHVVAAEILFVRTARWSAASFGAFAAPVQLYCALDVAAHSVLVHLSMAHCVGGGTLVV